MTKQHHIRKVLVDSLPMYIFALITLLWRKLKQMFMEKHTLSSTCSQTNRSQTKQPNMELLSWLEYTRNLIIHRRKFVAEVINYISGQDWLFDIRNPFADHLNAEAFTANVRELHRQLKHILPHYFRAADSKYDGIVDCLAVLKEDSYMLVDFQRQIEHASNRIASGEISTLSPAEALKFQTIAKEVSVS